MTELQSSISSLKEVITSGNRLLFKLEKAQKDLDTPPQHRWEHGDVFRNCHTVPMICIKISGRPLEVFCTGGCIGHRKSETDLFLKDGKFLFNIKEKL